MIYSGRCDNSGCEVLDQHRILEILEGKVLNTMQICRLVVRRNLNDSCSCPLPDGYKNIGKQQIQCRIICGVRVYEMVRRELQRLKKDGKVFSEKRLYFDRRLHPKGKKQFDLFRLWWVDPKVYEERVAKNFLPFWFADPPDVCETCYSPFSIQVECRSCGQFFCHACIDEEKGICGECKKLTGNIEQ